VKLERVVVGVDGSANSRRAVEWAAGLAARVDAEVVAVHALGLLERLDTGAPVPTEEHRDEIVERFQTAWCAPLDEAGVANRRIVRYGPPADVLLELAEEVGADLVVVGSRGVSDRPELLLGSTSARVAQHARQPVVIVPPTAD